MRKLFILLLLVGCVLRLAMPEAVGQTLANRSPAELRHLVQQGPADTNRVQALLWLSEFYRAKEGASRRDLDSARTLAQQAAELSRRLGYARGRDWAAFKTGETYLTQHATKQVMTIAQSLSDTSRIKLLLALAQSQFEERFTQKAHPDSALALFQQTSTLSQTLGQREWQQESLFRLGTCYMRLEELQRGKACFQQVIKAHQRSGNKTGELKAWYRMGTSYAYNERAQPKYFAAMRACFQPALTLARQTHNQEYEALTRMQLALIQYAEGQLPQAEDELLQVVALQKAIGYKEVYYTYSHLSDISRRRGYLNRSLEYTLQVIKSLEDAGETQELDYIYYKVAENYYTSGQTEKTIDALNQSLAISRQKGQVASRDALGAITRLMAMALVKQGKARGALLFVQDIARRKVNDDPRDNTLLDASFADCYTALQNYPLAEHYYLRSLTVGKHLDPWYLVNIKLGISHMYVRARQYAKAEPYLQQLVAAPVGQVSASSLQKTHLLSYKVDSAAGRYLSAMSHLRQQEALKDSLFSEAKSRQLEELQVQFETKEKEQNIALLTKQTQVQQALLRQQAFQRNAFLVGALLLTLVLGLGYNRYRLQQRSNQLLEAQQAEINEQNSALQHLLTEKEWMLKEIHHRVKNNLEVISSLLETQSDYLHEPVALTALREGQNRVHAMALIHQKLYQSANLSVVNMAAYIREIAEHLVESFDDQDTVQLRLHVMPIELDVALATPLGLIINEALTNVLKYAFPNQRPGTITIELAETEPQCFRLLIEDDGAGFPPGFDMEGGRTMGLTIMRGLSGQIDGKLRITQTPGVRVSLHFEAVASPVLV